MKVYGARELLKNEDIAWCVMAARDAFDEGFKREARVRIAVYPMSEYNGEDGCKLDNGWIVVSKYLGTIVVKVWMPDEEYKEFKK